MKKPAWDGARGSSALILFFASVAMADAETWNLTTGGSWNNPANWTPGSVPNGVGASATFTSIQTIDRVITFDSAVTIGALNITNGTSFSNTIGVAFTTPPITFDAPANNAAMISVLSSADSPAPSTVGSFVVLNDPLLVTTTAATGSFVPGTLIFEAFVTGAGGITKEGSGTLVFTDTTKVYNGATVVNAGILRIDAPLYAPSGTSAVSVNSSGQIALAGPGDYTLGTGSIPLTVNGAGAGGRAGALRFEGTDSASLANPIVLQADSVVFVRDGSNLTLPGVVSGPGGLTKTGDAVGAITGRGTLILTAANTYMGQTEVLAGGLVVGGSVTATPNASLGRGNVIVNGVQTKLTIETGVLNAIADTAALTLAGGGTLRIPDTGFVELDPGVNEVIGGLVLGNIAQGPGTYGSTLSSAAIKNDDFFAGSGIVTVIPEPNALSALLAGWTVLLASSSLRQPRRSEWGVVAAADKFAG